MAHCTCALSSRPPGVFYPANHQFTTWGASLLLVKPELITVKALDFDRINIGVRLVGEEEGRSLNSVFRGIPQATNILSFPFAEAKGGGDSYIGDLVLTVDLINREANKFSLSREQYWAHLYIHGFLHLLGYMHNTTQNTKHMRKWENLIMRTIGFDPPYPKA